MRRDPFKTGAGLLLACLFAVSLTACSKAQTSSGMSSVPSGQTTASTQAASSDVSGGTLSSTPAETEPSSEPGGEDKTQGTASQQTKATTSGKTTPTTSGKPTSLTRDQVMQSMPANLKGTTIDFFFWEDPKNTISRDAIAAFEKATGITVKTEIANKQSYTTQLAGKIAAGSAPDLVKLVENNMSYVANIQPLANSGFNFNDTAWDTELMKNFTFNGRVYATNVKNSPNQNMAVILYNKRALQKAEMEDPYEIWEKNPSDWTWDKLWEMCDTFLKANRNREGYYGITFGIEDGYPRSFGSVFWGYDPSSGKWTNYMKDAEVVKRYEILIDAIGKNYSTSSWDSRAFTMGNILFAYTYSSSLEKESTAFSSIRENLGAVPIPTDSTHQPLFEYSAYGIPVGADNAAAVPYYLRYVMAPESYDLNDFYMNDEAKKVVDSMASRGNFFFGNGYRYDVWQELLKGTASQVRTTLDANYGIIDDLCYQYNDQMSTLPT